MDRRHFLALAGTFSTLGGCSALGSRPPTESPSTNTDSMTTNTPTDTPMNTSNDNSPGSDTVARQLSIADVDSVPESIPFSLGVSITEPEVTADTIGKVEVALVTSEKTKIKTGPPAPFTGMASDEDTPGLVLLEPSGIEYIERVDDRHWTPDRPENQQWSWKTSLFAAELAPNRALVSELHVWDDYQYDGYLEPGTYRFSNVYNVDGEKVEWGFVIKIARG